jgi:Asp-tRNA(Asn)/Glu-tRNA(Gln) amidotransferase A subunit family amidase
MDSAVVVDAIAGLDPRDNSSLRRKPRGLSQLNVKTAKGSRVAIMGFSPSEPVGRLFLNALQTLEDSGLKLSMPDFPDLPYSEVAFVIREAEADVAFDDIIQFGHVSDLIDPLYKNKERYWLTGRPSDYVRAQAIRAEMLRVVEDYFRRFDLIVSVNPDIAPPIDVTIPSTGGDFMNTVGALLGLPTVSVPMGFVNSWLPAGYSITGRWMDDARVLAAAALYQSRTDWHNRVPRAIF